MNNLWYIINQTEIKFLLIFFIFWLFLKHGSLGYEYLLSCMKYVISVNLIPYKATQGVYYREFENIVNRVYNRISKKKKL